MVNNNKFIADNNEEEEGAEKNENGHNHNYNHRPTLVEKYLKISDFIEYIFDNKEIFLEEKFQNVKS